MARTFDAAQSEYLQVDRSPITAYPLTMACWAYSWSLTLDQCLMYIGDKDNARDYQYMNLRGGFAGDYLQAASSRVVSGSAGVFTTVAYPINSWFHAAAVYASSSSRSAYIHGGNKATNTTDIAWTANADRMAVGMIRTANPFWPLAGRVAWPAWWDVALTDGEVAALAAGAYPPTIRPAHLKAFWPLGGFETAETDGGAARDIWGGYDMSAFSGATGPGIVDHPGGLVYPAPAMAPYASPTRTYGGRIIGSNVVGASIIRPAILGV